MMQRIGHKNIKIYSIIGALKLSNVLIVKTILKNEQGITEILSREVQITILLKSATKTITVDFVLHFTVFRLLFG